VENGGKTKCRGKVPGILTVYLTEFPALELPIFDLPNFLTIFAIIQK
jgi:hypothetical protein